MLAVCSGLIRASLMPVSTAPMAASVIARNSAIGLPGLRTSKTAAHAKKTSAIPTSTASVLRANAFDERRRWSYQMETRCSSSSRAGMPSSETPNAVNRTAALRTCSASR